MHRLLTILPITFLVACGSDDDSPSLTEPNSNIMCEASSTPVDFTGTFSLEWACGGESPTGQGELGPCDPANNPLLGEDSVTVSVEFQGARTITAGEWSVSGQAIAPGFVLIQSGTDGAQERTGGGVTGCSDGRFALSLTWRTLDGSARSFWAAEMKRQH